jgi:hypothetical protein
MKLRQVDEINYLTIVGDQLTASIFFLSNSVLRFTYVRKREVCLKNID